MHFQRKFVFHFGCCILKAKHTKYLQLSRRRECEKFQGLSRSTVFRWLIYRCKSKDGRESWLTQFSDIDVNLPMLLKTYIDFSERL